MQTATLSNKLETLAARIRRSVQSPAYCIERLFQAGRITAAESAILQAEFGLAR
jgi:hypothetical protein